MKWTDLAIILSTLLIFEVTLGQAIRTAWKQTNTHRRLKAALLRLFGGKGTDDAEVE